MNKAIDDYLIKTGKLKADDSKCCPFCDHEDSENDPVCKQGCQVNLTEKVS